MPELTVVSWTCRRATVENPLRDYLLELDPAVALPLEVGEHPPIVAHFRREPTEIAAGPTP